MADQAIERVLAASSHFEVLQITHGTATDEEVKKRYRVLALQTHPDKNKHERAEEAFKRVTGAFQSLDTREKRDQYHARGGQGFKHHDEEEDDDFDDMDFGHDAHAFFNMFMQMGGRGFGGGNTMQEMMFMMMMMNQGEGGMFYDEEDGMYYEEYYDDDDEYFDDGDENDDDEEEEEEEYDDRPGRFNRELQKYVCEKCHVETATREQMIEHLQSKRHERVMEQEDFFCTSCHVHTKTKTAKQDHLSSKKHLRNLRTTTKT